MNARPAPPTVPPPRFRRGPVIAGIAVAIALVLGGWGLWRGLAGGAGDEATPAQLRAQQRRIESLEQLRALEAGWRIAVALAPSPFPPGVDTPEDLERAERTYQAQERNRT